MKALITGASDGIGRDMAHILASRGCEVYVVARNTKKLNDNFKNIPNCKIINLDLSQEENCFKLYSALKYERIDILINNAGIGCLGEFSSSDLRHELQMIDINIKAVHILTKLFLQDMLKRNKGYILNVASIGAFFPSPLIASYYASKSYILNLTIGINQEIKSSNVYIGALCPGTIKTNFHKKAGANKNIKGANSKNIAKYAIKSMFERKTIIIPSLSKAIPILVKFIPNELLLKILYKIQIRKI